MQACTNRINPLKTSSKYYETYSKIASKVAVGKEESREVQDKKRKGFLKDSGGYERVKREIQGFKRVIEKDKDFKKLARDNEILIQKDLSSLLTPTPSTPTSISLLQCLQSPQESFSTQLLIPEHYPTLHLLQSYPHSYFDAKRKYSSDLDTNKFISEKRITEYLELNYSVIGGGKKGGKEGGKVRAYKVNCLAFRGDREDLLTSKEVIKETLSGYDDLRGEICAIEELKISFCSFGMREIMKIFRNSNIETVGSLELNTSERDLLPKMTPLFCRQLCQFIETRVKKRVSVSNFQLHSGQVNLILKAARKLESISITDCAFLDKGVLRMSKQEFCSKNVETCTQDWECIDKVYPLRELKIQGNYYGDMNRNNGHPQLKELNKIDKKIFYPLIKDLEVYNTMEIVPSIIIEDVYNSAERGRKSARKSKKKKGKINFYQKDPEESKGE